MRRIILFLFAALVCVPSSARAQQLPGNPNSGTVTVSTSMVNTLSPYTNSTGGTIQILSSGTLTNSSTSTLTTDGMLNNSGTLTNQNYLTLLNNGTLNNYGTLNNTADGTLTNLNDLRNLAGGTLNNDGQINNIYGGFQNLNGGTYAGNGTISGVWLDHGTQTPGSTVIAAGRRGVSAAGVLTTEGNYYKRAGSHEIELGGLFDGGGNKALTEFDWLDVTGDVELAGTLEVYLIDSFELLAGMSFEILKVGGTLTGEYDGLDEGHKVGSFSGTNLYITYAGGNGNDVTLFSRAVPEPATILLALFGLALLPRRRRR